MVFGVMAFGLTSTALLVTFAKYLTKYWFAYFMTGVVVFEIAMFLLTKGRKMETERAPTRQEKKEAAAACIQSPTTEKNSISSKNQALTKQEKAAAKKAPAKAATTAK